LVAAAVEAAVAARFVEPVIDPVKFESLFFASERGAVAAGLIAADAERTVADPLVEVLDVVVVVVGLETAFGGVEVVDRAGLRAAAVLVAVVGLLDVVPDGSIEVRRAVVDAGFFSSTDDVDLWEALDEVGPVALVAGLRTADPAAGRVGGLLNPLVAVRDTEEVVGFVVEDEEDPKRFAGTAVRLAGTFSFLPASTDGPSLSVSVSTSEASPAVSSPAVSPPDTASGALSSWWTASVGSVSAIFFFSPNFSRILFAEMPQR
jgi:hypothetical protein